MFAALKLFYHNAARLLFKGAILSEPGPGLPGRSLCSYMANVKSVVLIIGRGHTMRTRLRRDKRRASIRVFIECAPDPRPTCCLNNNFKRMSHCITDYSDLSPLNRDKAARAPRLHFKEKRWKYSIIAEYLVTHIVYVQTPH